MMKSPKLILPCLMAVLLLPACGNTGLNEMTWAPDLLKKKYEPFEDEFLSQAPPSRVSAVSSAPVNQVFIGDNTAVSDVVSMGSTGSKSLSEDADSNSIEIFDLDSPRSVAAMSSSAVSMPVRMQQTSMMPPVSPSPMMQMPMAQASMANVTFDQMPHAAQALPTADPSVTIYSLDGLASGDMGQAGFGYGDVGFGTNGGQMAMMNSSGAGFSGGNSSSGQIFFKHGSSRLGGGDIRKISSLAEKAKFAPVNYITVEGHASKPTQAGSNSTEAHILNLRQALKRSEKVSKELVRQGVPGDKIKTVGWGAGKASGNEAQDRRVDVVMGER